MSRLRWNLVNWPNSLFLVGTLALTLTAVPWFVWRHGLDWFQAILFIAFFIATGLSITLGYHRLFSHLTFKARWPVRLLTLIFGAAAFENSVLSWAADHRKHHKFVDHEEDPYNISKGFFHAHIGWIMSDSPPPSLEGVKDLQADPLIRWQHRHYLLIAILTCFALPALLGFWDISPRSRQVPASWMAMFVIALTTASLYISTLCRNSMSAFVLSIPVMSVASALATTLQFLLVSLIARAYNLPRYRVRPVDVSGPHLWVVLVLTAGLLWFGFVNHRTADRSVRRVALQTLALAGSFVAGLTIMILRVGR